MCHSFGVALYIAYELHCLSSQSVLKCNKIKGKIYNSTEYALPAFSSQSIQSIYNLLYDLAYEKLKSLMHFL